MSKRPAASWGSRLEVVPSATTSWRLGWVCGQLGQEHGGDPAGRGADHADPDVAAHVLAQGPDVGGDGVDLAQDPVGPGRHHLALGGEPAGRAVDQGGPQLLSSRATWAEMLDWTVPRASAAAENEPCSDTATRACRCLISITNKDSRNL